MDEIKESTHNGYTATANTLEGLAFDFSRFKSKTDNAPKSASMAWPEIVALLENRRLTGEAESAKDGPLFSGAAYPEGAKRGNESVSFVSLAILDFDDGAPLDWLEVKAREIGAATAIYSTWSHTPHTPKFRLVMPLAAPVAAKDWPHVWQRLNAAFEGKADRSAKDAARIHYLPSCPRSREGDAVFLAIEGRALEVDSLPEIPQHERRAAAPVARLEGADKYAAKAFENEIGRLCMAQNGGRNNALNKAALSLGHFIGAGRLNRGDVENALENAARSLGLGESEARKTIQSGLNAGEKEPNEKGLPKAETAKSISFKSSLKAKTAEASGAPKITPGFPCTDAGNGERFAYHHFETARYVFEWKRWIVWNGRFWERDFSDVAARLAKETARLIPAEAKAAKGDEYAQILKHAIATEAHSRLNAMLERARSEEGMTLRTRDLDADRHLFNVANGTLDLRGAVPQFRAHSRDDFLTKTAPVVFDSGAKCPKWRRFLCDVFDGNDELARYIQRVVGKTLCGDTSAQMFPVFWGAGSNGKSVLLRVLEQLFGDYAHKMEPQTICAKYGDRMATDIAELFGKRFVYSSETNEGRRLDEGMIKQMTGGEKLTGERKFENPFTFTPQFQIFFCTNHKPEIRGTDNGIWRRVQLVPFTQTFWSGEKGESGPPNLRADAKLFEKLENEMSGILNWALEGFADWRTNGLGTPDAVKNATAEYRDEQDTLGDFFKERCVIATGASVPNTEIYQAFCKWAEENGQPRQNAQTFGRKMRERGFTKNERSNKRPYLGIGLSAEN